MLRRSAPPHAPLFALLLGLLLGCAGAAQTLTVFAASSLSDAFADLADRFEAANPGVQVQISTASSSTLATQLLQGARADLFASANDAQLERVASAGLVLGDPVVIARNTMALMVAESGPLYDPADLAEPGVLVVMAAPQVPAGAYGRDLLERLGATIGPDYVERVVANVVSEEPNVRQVAAKVALGEADAGIVYGTDALGLPGVRLLALPAGAEVIASYPLALLAEATEPELADAFRAFVLSDEGHAVLGEHGFEPP